MSDAEQNQRLQEFVERVLHVAAQYISIFGKGVPGMLGTSAEWAGSHNEKAVQQLHRDTLAFAKAFTANDATTDELARQVEADLLVVTTLEVLTQEESDALIDELHNLSSGKI